MTERGQAWRPARYLLIFGTGLFGLVAQTILFRDFFTVFEGHEIGIGAFFGSWLIWVAAGAALGRLRTPAAHALARHFPLAVLLFLPAYLLQSLLIARARELAGVAVYELFPLARLAPMAMLVNAPVSLCTGLVFCLACRWMRGARDQPVSRVYLAEAAGGAAGGIGVTFLLAANWSGPAVILLAGAALLLTVAVEAASRRAYVFMAATFLVAAASTDVRLHRGWEQARQVRDWQRLLPVEALEGSFTTSHARYLYGTSEGQFNAVAWNGVVDALPRPVEASEVVALHLAQQPRARRFLVVGPGSLALCRRLLDLPAAEEVVWLHPDPEYPGRVLEVLPPEPAVDDPRWRRPGVDVRRFLREEPDTNFDAVILNLPDVTTLALNRYSTREFFEQVRARLAPDGVLGVRTLGGDNFMGDDLVNVGASMYTTLGEVFPERTLKPGDETWIFAAGEGVLSPHPAELRDRFRTVDGGADIYPPEGLMSLFLPDRMAYQLGFYQRAIGKDRGAMLVNTDARPRALLHGLLFAARQAGSGIGATTGVYTLVRHGALLLPVALLFLALLRVVYVTHGRDDLQKDSSSSSAERSSSSYSNGRPRPLPPFDLYLLVAATGCAGMGLSLVLMYAFQALLGSIFLYVGLVSALFMAGLVAGGLAVQGLTARRPGLARPVILVGIALQAGAMLLLTPRLGDLTTPQFAALFGLFGLLGGAYVPAGASLLAGRGVPVRRAASGVELSDHLGGAVGGLGVGLLLLPVFGPAYALALLVLLLLLLPLTWAPALARRGVALTADRFDAVIRPLGYSLFAVAAMALGTSLWLHHASRPSAWQQLAAAARDMAAEDAGLEERRGDRALAGYRYLVETDDEGTRAASCFTDLGLCQAGAGFAGPIHLAVRVDPEGALLDFRLLDSSETPSYVAMLDDWRGELAGKNLFDPNALEDVDGVTGATLTSEAVLRTLHNAGGAFAADILHLAASPDVQPPGRAGPDRRVVTLLTLAAVALALRARPCSVGRRVLLGTTLVLAGWLLNVQYALAQVFALLRLDLPPPGLTAAFLLAAALPVLVAVFGNVYCGYLCPFGALQELIGELRPARVDLHPGPSARRLARMLKFGILFVCVMLFARSLDPAEAAVDPLVGVFSTARSPTLLWLVGITLVAAFFFNRFWCRYLCPTGAFLSLLNGVRLFRRLRPTVRPGACGFGVRALHDLDCLQCDRCRALTRREQARLQAQAAPRSRGAALLFAAALVATSLLFVQHATEVHRGAAVASAALGRGAGQARPSDVRRLRQMIREGQLSDREAMYYHEEQEAQPESGERPGP